MNVTLVHDIELGHHRNDRMVITIMTCLQGGQNHNDIPVITVFTLTHVFDIR